MSDITSFAQASRAFADIRQQLQGNEDIAAVRSYAVENADLYQSLLSNERFAQFDGAVRDVFSVAQDAVRIHVQQAVNTATYALGIDPVFISGKMDPDAVRSSASANASVSASRGPGHATYSPYLNSHQEQMTAGNAKDVDYNILSELSYAAKWSKNDEYIKASQREGITVKEYCNGLLEHLEDTPENMLNRNYLKEVAESDRFSGLTVDHALGNIGTGGGESQVLVVGTGDGHAVMAVQGTNGDLKDWGNNKEFFGSDPAQEERWVTSVLNRYASEYDRLDLTGHSQGGREAITAAMFMDDENIDKIKRVVSNDGPGYSPAFFRKHGDRIDRIADRVTIIRPDASYVGSLELPVNINVKIVESIDVITGYKDGEPQLTHLHEGTCWYVDTNGNYVEAKVFRNGLEIDKTQLLKQLAHFTIQTTTPVLTEFLGTYMPEDRVEDYIDRFFHLFDGGNGRVDFGCFDSEAAVKLGEEFIEEFKADMDKLNREQLNDCEYSILVVCEAFNDFYSSVDGYLLGAEVFCEVMAVALSETVIGGEIFAAFAESIKIVRTALKVVNYICMGVRIALNITAYIRAAKKKKIREKYIANHPEIEVQVQHLQSASEYLHQVAACLQRADQCYDDMLGHFKNKVRKLATDLAQEVTGENKWVDSISNVSRNDAAGYCLAHGVKRIGNSGIGRVNKGAATIGEIADKTGHVLSALSLPGSSYIRVLPTNLSQAGANGATRADMIQEQMEKVDNMIASLKGQYIGKDADSLSAKWSGEYVSALETIAKAFRQRFDQMQEIAGMYSQYQSETIETFQNMRLGLGLFD